MSKIIRLEAENVKRLRAVSITPDGSMVTIRGENGQGKSSVLDSIEYALGGERTHPAEPIRRGAEKARVVLETDDGLVVERRFTAKGTYLDVRTKDGLRGGQKTLDGLVGKLSFDPLAFMREKPDRQAETLRSLVGLDFTLLDRQRKQAYDERTIVNRTVEALKARIDALPEVDAPAVPVSAGDLLREQERRRELAAENEGKRVRLAEIRKRYVEVGQRITADEIEITRLEKLLEEARALLAVDRRDLDAARAAGEAVAAEVKELVDPDLDEIPRRLMDVDAVNERVRQRAARAALQAELATAEQASAGLSGQIEDVDARKAEALEAAAFPVPGLAFSDEGVTLNGLPLAQASSAEQLRVSVAMGLTLNPKLKVLLIRDGSLLDERSLALVAEMAERAKAQVWIEIVGKEGAGIVIEDGQVEGAEAPAEAAHA